MAQHIFTGSGIPSSTPTKVGQHYIDTTNSKSYISTGTSSSADWKDTTSVAGSAVTSLTGDVTGTGPGATATTLANTAVTPGSYGSATQVPAITVDSKGRLTSASNTSIQITESQVTNLTSDLAGKQPTGNYITALTSDVTASGPGSAAATVVKIQGRTIASTAPTSGQVLAWNSGTSQWEPTTDSDVDTGITQLTGEVTAGPGSGSQAATVTNSAVIGKVLTGFVSGTGTVAATDTILQAINKLDGNDTLSLKKASNLSDLASAATARTNLGLGTLATQSGTFSGTSSGTNTGDQTITLTGDVTGTGTGSFATTLANTAVTANSYGSASSVATFTVDAKGRLTAAASTAISILSSAVSNFASTVLATVLTGYTIGTNTVLSATDSILVAFGKVQAQISAILTTTISAGTSLNGGGDLSTNRTINHNTFGTAGTYGSSSSVPVITTEATGHISGVVNTAISILAAAVTDFSAAVRLVTLTGYTVGTNTALAATDTILGAFEKIQGQLDNKNPLILTTQITASNTNTTLTATSATYQQIIGTVNGQRITLPNATTMNIGDTFYIVNQSPTLVPVFQNGGTLIEIVYPYQYLEVELIDNTSAAGIWFDELSFPGYVAHQVYTEEFLSTNTTTGNIGNLGWVFQGTGAAVAYQAGTNQRTGVVRHSSGTGNNANTSMNLGTTNGFILGGGAIVYESYVSVPTLGGTGAAAFTSYIGLQDTTGTGDNANGVYFEYAGTAGGTINWNCKTASASTRTTTGSGIAVNAGQWYKLTIVINDAGTSVAFYIDGNFITAITTNIPTSGIAPAMRIIAGATNAAAKSVDYDYTNIYKTLATVR